MPTLRHLIKTDLVKGDIDQEKEVKNGGLKTQKMYRQSKITNIRKISHKLSDKG